MIAKISDKLANFLYHRFDDSKYDQEVYSYGIYIFIMAVLHVLSVVLIGLLLNMVLESLVFYGAFICVRKFAGGFHAKSPLVCYIISMILNFLVVLFIKLLCTSQATLLHSHMFTIIVIFATLIVVKFSPISNENKPLNDKELEIYGAIASIASAVLLFVVICLSFFDIFNLAYSVGFGLILSAGVVIAAKTQEFLLRRGQKNG